MLALARPHQRPALAPSSQPSVIVHQPWPYTSSHPAAQVPPSSPEAVDVGALQPVVIDNFKIPFN